MKGMESGPRESPGEPPAGEEAFWDREVERPTHISWLEPLPVRHYVNEAISGNLGTWPLEWFRNHYPGPYARALSVGCGTGPLERSLISLNLCETIDAFDGSIRSVAIAAQEARAVDTRRIRYFAADFNRPSIARPPGGYDAVFFHQSAHHVGKLERLFSNVLSVMKPDGVLYLEEYVGPSRHHWNEEAIAPYDALYQQIPKERRFFDRFPLPVQYEDLSEAVRSAEIVPQLEVGFEIEAFRGYGGNVLSVLIPVIRPHGLDDDLIVRMIETEKEWLARGAAPFCAVIVARPKRGRVRRAAAVTRYFVVPKVRRIVREIRARIAR